MEELEQKLIKGLFSCVCVCEREKQLFPYQ